MTVKTAHKSGKLEAIGNNDLHHYKHSRKTGKVWS